MIEIRCAETGVKYFFKAKTPYEAMQKMIYTLNLSNNDSSVVINKTDSGLFLWIEHGEKTYFVKNK